jgi:thiamine pyrophosphokinase
MNTRTAWVFANGAVQDDDALRRMIRPDDALIAADGGLRHILRLNLYPLLIIGDMDSADPQDVARLEAEGVEVRRYPPAKDETDLQLALAWALQNEYRSIRIAAALGDRLDHTLGNLFLLADPALIDIDIRLEDGREEAFLIRDEAVIEGQIGDRVSLLPLGDPAVDVETVRLLYPLRRETLRPDRTRGISNEMVAETARVSLTGGLLICIHTRGGTGVE